MWFVIDSETTRTVQLVRALALRELGALCSMPSSLICINATRAASGILALA